MTTSSCSLGTYFLLLFFFAVVGSVSSENCSYAIYVKTGLRSGSETNSKKSAILKDAIGSEVKISNLEQYGLMGSDHHYFNKGNYDIFTITATCTKLPVCSLTLSSDYSGPKSGWYVEHVRVLTSRGPIKDITFVINGWLAKDKPPYELTRTFNMCPPIQLQ